MDAALAVLGKLEGGKFATVSRRTLSATARSRPERPMGESQGDAGEEIGVLCCFTRLPKNVVWRGIKPQRLKAGLIFSTYGMPEGIP